MENILVPILVPLGLFGMITAIVIFIASRRHKERIELIKRGINPVQLNPHLKGNSALLLGLICIAFGLALLISVIVDLKNFDQDMLTGGLISLLCGVSLIVYWKLTAGDRERAFQSYERYLTEEQSKNQMLNTGTAETGEVASPGAENRINKNID